MICYYWYFKDIVCKYEPYVCNRCHDLLMVFYDLKNFMILNIKGVDYRCYVFNMSKNDAITLLHNSVFDNKGVMDFGTNKTPVEIIKEGAFGKIYSRDIYSSTNGKSYRKSWKEFNVLENNDRKYYCSNYYDVSVNKYGVKWGTSLRFWENKGWINLIDP